MEKKPFIIHASIGHGHCRAAEILQRELKLQTTINPQVLDLVLHAPYWKSIKQNYYRLLQHAPFLWGGMYKSTDVITIWTLLLKNVLKACMIQNSWLTEIEKAPLIISTHPIVTAMLAEWKKARHIQLPLYHVHTDFGFHQVAEHSEVNGYFLSNLATPPAHTSCYYQFGIPVEPKRQTLLPIDYNKKKYSIHLNKKVIMIAGGGEGLAPFEKIIHECKWFPPSIFLCMTGLKHHKQRIYTQYGHEIHVIPFTSAFSDYVQLADVLITKAGGLTLAHALTTNTPVVLFQPIPGQETENAYLLEEKEAVCFVQCINQLSKSVNKLLRDPVFRDERIRNAHHISRPDATRNIIQQIVCDHGLFSVPLASKSIAEY
ncbi:MGDG synthase family glycosyltransferase [Alkalicoccobacillus porphyridii]|uniref:MGDG synthase family glycosyltransferase n=1 Tax=Alkalicoccobacillus porphyridii TaxID=2597270 RepID=UPI00163D484F|nr:glycosyltransferase [Alkalicoccobacillus porphyridii]